MLKIEKLRLKNFKSFKKAVVPFSQGFTVIAGSNGSGKSNILDSLMFVLGITSLKTLRAGKLVDLINFDAKENYATVEIELTFDGKNYLVSRSIDKEGKSVCRIDAKRVALNEVSSFLTELGLTPDGHNIVMQGDVTRIIEMNPIQRRQIIEDLAGLKEFDEKKLEALKELEKVDTRIKEVNIVLKERRSFLEALEQEKNAALEFRQLETELNQSKATILGKEIEVIKQKNKESSQRMDELKKEKASNEVKKDKLLKEETELKKRVNELNQKILSENEKAYASTGIEIEETKSEKKLLEQKTSSKQELINRLNARIHALSEKNVLIKKEIEKNQKEIEEIIAEEKINSRELEKIVGMEGVAEAQSKALNKQISDKEEKLKLSTNELIKLKEEFFEQKSEINRIRKEIEGQQKSLVEIKKLEEQSNLIEEIKRIKKLREEIIDSNKKLKQTFTLSEAIKEKSKELTAIQQNLKELMALREKIEAQIAKILKLLESFSEFQKEEEILKQKSLNEKQLIQFETGKGKVAKELELKETKISELERELEKLKIKLIDAQEQSEEVNELRIKQSQFKHRKESKENGLNELQKNSSEALKEIEASREEIELLQKDIELNEGQEKILAKKIKEKEIELEKALKSTKDLKLEKEEKELKLEKLLEQRQKIEIAVIRLERNETEINIENGKNEVRLNDLEEEFKGFEGIKAIEEKDLNELKKRIIEIDKRIKELGAINMKALESFDEFAAELIDIKNKSEKLEQERLAVLDMIEKIEVKRKTVFMDCFNQINTNFREMYDSIAEGEGQLRLTNEEDVLNSGLLIEAKHKLEKVKNIDAMSGGEKTLTALAFLFAIQLFEPAPFYFFDEADAALDKENSVKVARIINAVAKKSQFIAISHNDPLIKEADQIIGVALSEDKSSVIGLKLKKELEKQVAKTEA